MIKNTAKQYITKCIKKLRLWSQKLPVESRVACSRKESELFFRFGRIVVTF